MGDDRLFRLILLIAFVVLMPIGIYFRLRSITSETLDRRQEGWFILIALRLAGLAGIGGVIAYLVNPARMAWASVQLPVWMRWMGVGFGVMAGSLLVWTFSNLGKNLTDTVVTRKGHTLVMTGPYRWVRHPFYCSVMLAVLASSLAAANWFIFAAGTIVFALQVIRARKEEANLAARFGDEYRNYVRRTGRFVPRLGVRG